MAVFLGLGSAATIVASSSMSMSRPSLQGGAVCSSPVVSSFSPLRLLGNGSSLSSRAVLPTSRGLKVLSSSRRFPAAVVPETAFGGIARRAGFHVGTRRLVIRGRAAADKAPPVKKKEDSAKKRARLAEDRRVYNKSRKTEIKTRMKKVFLALDSLKKKGAESSEEIKPIEAMIAEAFSIIDKSVKVGTLHRNTGGNRKSRLSRAKRAVEIQLGWYTPAAKA